MPFGELRYIKLCYSATALLTLAGCEGSDSRHPPIVDAGADQNVDAVSMVTLNGSAADVDGTIVSLSWQQLELAEETLTIILSDTDVVNPSFTAPQVSQNKEFTFELTAIDNDGLSATDTVTIMVAPKIYHFPLNDTGTTFGSDFPHGHNVTCIGENIMQQDCSHGRDATHNDDSDGLAGFSFTKLDEAGGELAADAVEWHCVRDNVTGLLWEGKTDDGGLHDKDNTYSYHPSSHYEQWGTEEENRGNCFPSDRCDIAKFVEDVTAEGPCGVAVWRLPTVDELFSIIHNGEGAPDPHYFPLWQHRNMIYWARGGVGVGLYEIGATKLIDGPKHVLLVSGGQ